MEHIKHVRHGESKTRLYRIWSNLKNRVLPNSVKAKYYFDRGIGLCDEWKNSFISFRDWSINNGYDEKLTLDRIDNDGSYTPENCRWVDMKVQSNNRSNNISVRIEEGCIPFSEICRVLSIDYMYAYNKVVKHLSQEIDVERTLKEWKEHVSEDVVSVAKQYVDSHVFGNEEDKFTRSVLVDMFCSGAKWQKEQINKKK